MSTDNKELEEKKQLMKNLFAEYERSDNEVEAVKSRLEESLLVRSEIVNRMANKLGKTKLRYKGEDVIIVSRQGKKEGAKETWFLRGAKKKNNDEEVIEID